MKPKLFTARDILYRAMRAKSSGTLASCRRALNGGPLIQYLIMIQEWIFIIFDILINVTIFTEATHP
jgi:hypothetical protein